MSAFTDAVAARYAAREAEADTFGRTVEVRRLRLGENFWVRALVASDLPEVATEALVASSVCSITDAAGKKLDLAPPRNTMELGARLDLLEEEGMSAAIAAYARLMTTGSANAAGPAADESERDAGTVDGRKVAEVATGHTAGAAKQGKRPHREQQPTQQAAE